MKSQVPSLLPDQLSFKQGLKLKDFTFARIGLEKSGISIQLKEILAFKADHASARDAIFAPFLAEKLKTDLHLADISCLELGSAAASRQIYLQRPDLGRLLNIQSEEILIHHSAGKKAPDIVIIISDGLSPLAVNDHACDLVKLLNPMLLNAGYSTSVVLLNQGRVAAADQIGGILKAKLSLILIGERPGLSSPDSMGAYLTYNPEIGLNDANRNCVSNIRPRGLPVKPAAEKLFYLIQTALTKRISGINLKDDSVNNLES